MAASLKQVAQCPCHKKIQPAAKVLRSIVDHVTSLAERLEVLGIVVTGGLLIMKHPLQRRCEVHPM